MSTVPSLTQIGAQLADSGTAEAIRVHTGGAGLFLGEDASGQPTIVSLFRPEPTLVVVIGGLHLAQLVCFRTVALGAAVTVTSVRPGAWSSLAEVDPAAIEVFWPDARTRQYGSSLRPQLLVVDTVATATVGAIPARPSWSTMLIVREQVVNHDVNLLGRADLIVTQRLSLHESTLLCGAAGVTDHTQALIALPADSVAAIAQSRVRSARLVQTTIERYLIGPVSRC